MVFISKAKHIAFKTAPWAITVVALYYAFHGVNWSLLLSHVGDVDVWWLLVTVVLTCSSYALRSWRWLFLFPEHSLSFINAARILVLGFFMNNIIPARAGEFVRAHVGAKFANQTRTLVLATIASERLVDGLTLSFMFVLFALGIGDKALSEELLYVAGFFGFAGLSVLALLVFRQRLFWFAERVHLQVGTNASGYAFDRFQVFINGLAPLTTRSKLPAIIIFSLIVWSVELLAYKAIAVSYSANLSWPQCVLFLVSVNFASLIPAAPGGVGVIEAVASAVLSSIGVPKELALTMVISQHLIQYLVVGIPGSFIMFTWKKVLEQVKQDGLEQPA